MLRNFSDRKLSDDDEAAFARLLARAKQETPGVDVDCKSKDEPYVFVRKFLFRVLIFGNAQLAQLAGCRGPNTQTNAACVCWNDASNCHGTGHVNFRPCPAVGGGGGW